MNKLPLLLRHLATQMNDELKAQLELSKLLLVFGVPEILDRDTMGLGWLVVGRATAISATYFVLHIVDEYLSRLYAASESGSVASTISSRRRLAMCRPQGRMPSGASNAVTSRSLKLLSS